MLPILALALGCSTEPAPATPAPTPAPAAAPAPKASLPKSGQPAPALSLPDVETGKTWTLADHLDATGNSSPKAVVLAFMASWCGYCTNSLPTLVELEKANPDLAIVTVTVDDQPETQKKELEKVRAAGLTGPVLAADAETRQTWIGGGKTVPKYYFVNRAGVITSKDDGFGDKVKPMMPKQAARALRD